MMPAMLYLLAISGLLAGVAFAIENVLVSLRVPRRGLWLAVLLMSAAWPVASVLSGREHVDAIPLLQQASPDGGTANRSEDTSGGDTIGGAAIGRARTLFSEMQASRSAAGASKQSLDAILAGAWLAVSIGVLLFYSFSAARLSASARRWRPMRLDGSEVLVSNRFGPAMFGLIRPRIVVPEWLLQSPPGVRAFVLRHEREHIAGYDHWVLAAALLLLALMPWNPVVWWQLRQLRFAIETDCDMRVLSDGSDAVAYAKALLFVGQHRSVTPLASMALTPSPSRLESRVRRFIEPAFARRTAVVAAFVLASTLLTAAIAIEAPRLRFDRAPAGQSESNGEDEMKAKALVAATLLAASAPAAAQWSGVDTTVPEGWEVMEGSGPDGLPRLCEVGTNAAPRDGTATVRCEHPEPIPAFGGLMQRIPADSYRGKRIRYSANVRSVGIRDPEPVDGYSRIQLGPPSVDGTRRGASVGSIWLRVMDAGAILAVDNGKDRGLHGDNNWTGQAIVVDVPENAEWLIIGFWMQGKGQIWITDIQLEEVGSNVPVTAPTIPYGPGVRNPTFQ